MEDIDLEAFRPVPFPELGPKKTFNANFCRNPMCPNFGPAPDLDASAERYSVFRDADVRTDRRFKCRLCEMSARLLSNHCLRAAYAWFKRQSIPFATCPRQGCVNAGVNVFEHWEPDLYGYDNKNRSDVVRCVKCGTRFSIGQALGLHGDKADPKGMERRLTTIFKHVRLGLGMRTSIALLEDPAIQQRHWLHAVERLAWKLLDYNSLCNAKLMAKRYPNRLPQLFRNANGGEEDPGPLDSPFNGIATLRTDMMNVSLRTPTARYENRFHPMPVLMTVMRIHRPSTWFLLAAHPCVVFDMADMPPAEKEDPNALVRDARAPVAERRFDHLYHSATRYPKPEENRRYRDEPEEKRGKRRQKTSYVGGGGRFMRLDYADIAHFMVVSELTRGFRQVTVCMDGERKAYRSCL